MNFYDWVAPVYGVWAALLESRAHDLAIEAALAHPSKDLLEVAVGTGTEFGRLLAARRLRACVGVDFSMGMLKQARKQLRTRRGNAMLCQADALALPFRTESFDALLNCYMIDLLEEREIPIVLQEFRRVLRNDGRLIVLTMAVQRPVVQDVWMALYRRSPVLVGYCRPIDAPRWLRESGWDVERQELITQTGFRSSLIVARPSLAARNN